ncbi:MAG: Gfo/Idh/MocA family oxidoreductase [Candidatus Glassbacteria bacterium]|nr:Gfo/Idh/MocA family oxidoreductase [Candidatus Glassbacteria bacterium]
MSNKIGVGFIGAGFITNFHIQSWQGVRDADITGIVSLAHAEATADNCRKYKVGDPKVFNSVTEMVADPGVDAIWICAPNYVRIQLMEEIVAALTSGKGTLIGIACEKPLARNVAEARRMLELVKEAGVLHGYLENQIFAPSITRGREIIWRRGAALSGAPYLTRCAEEHSGPHEPWFWKGDQQGGGVLNDMLCHSIEVARLLLTDPDKKRSSLVPKTVSAEIGCLKWSRPEYADLLKQNSNGQIDYYNHPAEDYARSTVTFEDDTGRNCVAEVSTSWSFVGAGLRLTYEVMGPEYSMQSNSLNTELNVFLSRKVTGSEGEDLVEKQNAEQGMMPVVSDEPVIYGYTEQNRHMARCFAEGVQPEESFEDGLLVMQLLMSSYMAAEQNRKLSFPPKGLDEFVPKVALGTWKAKDLIEGLEPE